MRYQLLKVARFACDGKCGILTGIYLAVCPMILRFGWNAECHGAYQYASLGCLFEASDDRDRSVAVDAGI